MSSTFALITFKVKNQQYSEKVNYETVKNENEKDIYKTKVLKEEYICPNKTALIRVLTLYIRAITNNFVDEIIIIL